MSFGVLCLGKKRDIVFCKVNNESNEPTEGQLRVSFSNRNRKSEIVYRTCPKIQISLICFERWCTHDWKVLCSIPVHLTEDTICREVLYILIGSVLNVLNLFLVRNFGYWLYPCHAVLGLKNTNVSEFMLWVPFKLFANYVTQHQSFDALMTHKNVFW